MKFKVKSAGWSEDNSLDDVMEQIAITSLSNRKGSKDWKASPVTSVSFGNDVKIFNTYFLLIKAGLCKEAEKMKAFMLKEFGIDMSEQPKSG
jgi:hypothetical protein